MRGSPNPTTTLIAIADQNVNVDPNSVMTINVNNNGYTGEINIM